MGDGTRGGGGSSRLSSLDALRGFAALAVVIDHFSSAYDWKFPGYPGDWFPLGGFGPKAVEMFFVISGFVILMTMGRVTSVGGFAYARFARLYPPYWGALLFVSAYILFAQKVLDAGIDQLTFSFPQFLANLTMVPTWFPWSNFEEIDDVFWSLSVEMGFYVVIGILFALGLTRANRIVPTLVVIWAIDLAANGLRFLSSLSSGDRGPFAPQYPHFFIAGMALFLLYSGSDRSNREKWILRILLFSAPVFGALSFEPDDAAVTLFIVTVAYVAVFYGLPFAAARPVQWLGRLSYSLYLVHCAPGYITMKVLMDHGWNRNLTVVVAIVQSFLLAIALHEWVEVPATRWLRQRRRRAPQLSDATPN